MFAGLGLSGVGTAVAAHAQPAPIPDYHWCPGQWWDPGWGQNWDGGNCHDDHHRDMDGLDHSRDWNEAPGRPDDRGPWQPQPWQR
ncbi:hypothetical protein A9W99_22550 [Mycobacterium sp. 1164966.3]|uniref:hypothetical protein n=1 Tax=Mycobacterium sp. 1164966.3 TaxID=1856861 RepID=UPI0007FCCD80|nr:hypothetical protein A9W99_22550 [Mycobacterium sp. 1164966.3]